MDRAGVERAVLLGWYWEQAETCVWQNRFYGRCVREHPDRLLAYATIHPGAGHWPTLGSCIGRGTKGWWELASCLRMHKATAWTIRCCARC